MAKRTKIVAPDNQTIGLEMQRKAVALAQVINEPLMAEIDILNKAHHDWEGGAFTVMHRLTSIMKPEELDNLPVPGSDSGNNPARYLVPITKISPKGKRSEEWKERDYYVDLALNLPGVVLKQKLKDQLERANGSDSVNKSDIPANVLDWDIDYRASLAIKLQQEIDGAVRAVTQAFGLYFQLKAFNTELQHVSATPIWALGPDGMPLNGANGRAMKVENTKKPIVIRSTIEGREMTDRKEVSIGTFLKYNVAKAAENNGGTYQAVMNTIARDKPEEQSGHAGGTGNAQDQSRPQAINTPETASARVMDVYVFLDEAIKSKDKANWQKIKKSLQGEDSDEDFLAWRGLLHYAKLLVGSPADDKRYKELTADMDDEDKVAA